MTKTTIPLLPMESHLLRVPSVSSITFYTSTEGSHDAIKAFVQARLDAITALNPWLQGQLHHAKGGGLMLDVPTNCQPVQLGQHDLPHLSPEMPYGDLLLALEPFYVSLGTELVGKPDQELFRAVWVSITPTQGALIMSLSHIVADGYTYYRLLNMLSSDRLPAALSPHRCHDVPIHDKGHNDSADLHQSWSMLWHMITSALVAPAPTVSVHTFSNEWIAAEKQVALPAKLSTNDIITAWYFQLCRSDVGFMIFNGRERYPDLPNDVAGNYSTMVGYQPEDYASPALIRQSLQTMPFRRAVSGQLPWMINKTTAMLSSWASLRDSTAPELPQWTPVAHFPLCTVSYLQPYTNVGVVFRKSATELGVVLRLRGTLADPSHLAKAVLPSLTP